MAKRLNSSGNVIFKQSPLVALRCRRFIRETDKLGAYIDSTLTRCVSFEEFWDTVIKKAR